MKKILTLIFMLSSYVLGVDATLEIVQKNAKIPYIMVEYQKGGHNIENMHKMLIADLKVSGHFQVYDGGTYDEKLNNGSVNFVDYANKKIDLVVRISTESKSPYTIDAKLYDINSSRMVIGKKYSTQEDKKYPFVSHNIAIDVNSYIKAPDISWMKRQVVLSKYTKSGESQIMLSDYTLSYQKTIITGGLNIFPKWGNKAQNIIYFTKYLDKPTIVKYDINTGKSEHLASSEGVAIVSDVSSDGSELLLSLSPNAQSDLYLYNVASKNLSRLTKYGGIDVGASFVDDEDKIVFISDRLGYANVFAMDKNGANVEQVVFHGRNNSSVSAWKNYLAYTSRESNNEFGTNTFNIYLISTQSDYIRRLTLNGVNQMPRFSSDGDSIMYLKHSQNQSALGIIRLNYNKSYLFPLSKIKIQSFDW